MIEEIRMEVDSLDHICSTWREEQNLELRSETWFKESEAYFITPSLCQTMCLEKIIQQTLKAPLQAEEDDMLKNS